MKFQEPFIRSVRLYFREEGDAWLKRLPNIIEYCEQKWSLKMNEPFSLSINYVAPAIFDEKQEVVVKICIAEEDFTNELKALKLLGKKGVVQVLDSDEQHRVILLQKLSPGTLLVELADDEKACVIAADVFRKIIVPVCGHLPKLPTMKEREESLRKLIYDYPKGFGPFSMKVLKDALRIFTYMNETTSEIFILHGDFHPFNILASGEDEWTAIDPKGLIGEMESDLIQYMMNKLPEQGAYDVMEKRVEIFTKELSLNMERLLLWGYCYSVLSTAWTVDVDGSYDTSFYRTIDIFKRLYEQHVGPLLIK